MASTSHSLLYSLAMAQECPTAPIFHGSSHLPTSELEWDSALCETILPGEYPASSERCPGVTTGQQAEPVKLDLSLQAEKARK